MPRAIRPFWPTPARRVSQPASKINQGVALCISQALLSCSSHVRMRQYYHVWLQFTIASMAVRHPAPIPRGASNMHGPNTTSFSLASISPPWPAWCCCCDSGKVHAHPSCRTLERDRPAAAQPFLPSEAPYSPPQAGPPLRLHEREHGPGSCSDRPQRDKHNSSLGKTADTGTRVSERFEGGRRSCCSICEAIRQS